MGPVDTNETTLMCPEGYELVEAEFADGGLFDNLPIGLTRQIADIMDANLTDVSCDAVPAYFDGHPRCSDRLRYAAG